METPRDYKFYIATRVMLRCLAKLQVDVDLVVIVSMDVPPHWIQALGRWKQLSQEDKSILSSEWKLSAREFIIALFAVENKISLVATELPGEESESEEDIPNTLATNGKPVSKAKPETPTETGKAVAAKDKRDDMSKVDADKFKLMIDEVDSLHQLVQKPREQVADAEALFDITNTLMSSVKAYRNEGMTPSDFVSCLLRDFGQQGVASSSQDDGRNLINWKEIGHMVSHVSRSAPGCCTMVGPMNTEMKQRKTVVHRKRTKPTEDIRPEELDDSVRKEKTDTDKNMAIMFDILRRNRNCKLENLIISRNSFAQTVENLFALSFLIKDGRAEIAVDEDGCHLVSPRNAPSANAILSGVASYSHFIFRFDFKDWKLMLASVGVGDELMPHRCDVNHPSSTQPNSVDEEAEAAPPTTPIRKLSRNRGLVMQEQIVVEDSPESGDTAAVRAAAIRKGKRKLT